MYRSVLNVFTQAKARFVIHLRPTDVEQQLADDGMRYADATAVEMMLQQLMAWGNLEAHPDTAEVLTVDDFWRVRNLYQMSAAGEAAEAALAVFEQSLRQPGELQAAALDDIRKQLDQVIFLSRQEKVDDADVFNAFSLLRQRFDELTARAAIPSLVAAVTGINDRRAGRSDRAADLRALALWFAEAEDDQAAHRLW